MFNSKRIEELERRIAALEPRPYFVTSTSTAKADPLKDLQDRVGKLETEVLPPNDAFSIVFMNSRYWQDREPKLTLREKVRRICDHLKITFKTEPEKVVIARAKPKK